MDSITGTIIVIAPVNTSRRRRVSGAQARKYRCPFGERRLGEGLTIPPALRAARATRTPPCRIAADSMEWLMNLSYLQRPPPVLGLASAGTFTIYT